jgi:hypothetical protein
MGLIEAFREHLQKRDRSEYTMNGYVRDLQTFFARMHEGLYHLGPPHKQRR